MAKAIDRGLENREIVLGILTEVLDKGNFVHLVLNQALSKYQYLEKPDRAFITRVTEGTLEYLLQIDFIINSYSKTKTEKMKPLICNILRMSVYQLLYMDRVPDSAVCNEAVKLAVHHHFQGLKGFVNGVLRTIARNKEELDLKEPYLRYSLPQWMYSMWEKDWGKESAEKIAASFLKERPVWVRCNLNLASKEEILAALKKQQVSAEQVEGFDSMLALSEYDHMESLDAFQKGWIQVQDISSALVGELAAPEKGSYIIDVCAAPGGKSLHLADKMEGTGCVEARDLTYQKVALIEENASRMGALNIKAVQWDATEFDPESENKADLVIADLPCSGLGIIGRKPDIKYHTTKENLRELSKLQKEILSVVWKYVKPGGRLIYSTCTINKEENAENARWITENLPFKPEDLTEAFSSKGERYACLKENMYPGADLKNGQIQILAGIHPFEAFDGFFISVFKREA